MKLLRQAFGRLEQYRAQDGSALGVRQRGRELGRSDATELQQHAQPAREKSTAQNAPVRGLQRRGEDDGAAGL
jgi:hypothetical protein